MIPAHPGGPGRLYKMTRVNAMIACDEGEEAFRAGMRPSDCPYAPRTAAGEFLAHFWLAGWWLAARPGVPGARSAHFARTFKGMDWGQPRR